MAVKFRQIFSRAGEGGNRRLFVILGGAALLFVAVFAFSSLHQKEMPKSNAGGPPAANPLPGGLNADPEQLALRQQDIKSESNAAAQRGESYTPDIAPGQSTTPVREVGVAPDQANLPPAPPAESGPHIVRQPGMPPVQTAAAYATPPMNDNERKALNSTYSHALMDLRDRINGRPPVTTIMFTAKDLASAERHEQDGQPEGSGRPRAHQSSTARQAGSTTVLIPAGRGIFAHTVTATNSDLSGNIVLQADSGPVAGDRLIASVSRAGGHMNRLVVTVTSIIHKGQELSVSGMVVAPDTMEGAVASSVDQLYFERFVFPAAAAFVQGLGMALETTSNTVGSVGGLGNVNYLSQLNFPQQLGVAAGAAASQVNSSLRQQMPTQPRINLAADVNVGVIFTKNVVTKG